MKKGFTLIELLIVIGILGILAIGLLAALDPIEQLKKARDTSVRNGVQDFYTANLRYNASREMFPWGASGLTTIPLSHSSMTGIYIPSLVTAGELKIGFLDDTTKLGKIFLTSTNPIAGIGTPMDDMAVCFAPESKSIKGEANTKYVKGGATQPGCPGAGLTCYWCAR